jgi:spore coat assembly protein SafA
MPEWHTNMDKGSPRYGHKYYIENGNGGKWHVYKDNTRIFLADPKPAAAPAPAAAAPVAAAPAPAASHGSGGAQAPAAPEHQWLTNTQQGNSRFGQKYYVKAGHNAKGQAGTFHIYQNGKKIFVPGGSTGGAEAPADDGGASAAAADPDAGDDNGATDDSLSEADDVTTDDGDAADTEVDESGVSDDDGGVAAATGTAGSSKPASVVASASTGDSDDGSDVPGPAPADDDSDSGDEGVDELESEDGDEESEDDSSVSDDDNGSSAGGNGPAPEDSGAIHTVAAGDTMWDIAQANHMSLDDLKALNPQIKNPNMIYPGDQINLGGTDAGATGADAGGAFPTTSSYENTEDETTSEEPDEVVGWGGNGANVAPDPASTAFKLSAATSNTDPLKINHNKNDKSSTA